MPLTLRKAERKQAKLKIGMSGPSGSGKTYSALLLASGMTDWGKIAVIDTENGSGELYSDLGDYNVITLNSPFHPNRYIQAIKECENAGMEVIIIDSITHEWNGEGGCLQIHEQFTQASGSKNSYTAWSKVTPLHDRFIQAILQSKCHIITCVRRKQDYEMTKDEKGRMKVQKVGMKEVTREGFEYELTLSFDINMDHYAEMSKDRTGLFVDLPAFKITKETGEMLKEWNLEGLSAKEIKHIDNIEIENPASQNLIERLKNQVSNLDDLNAKLKTSFKDWRHINSKQATNYMMLLMKK